MDTGLKFPEMIAFRDRFCREIGADLRVYRFEEAIANGVNPWDYGTVKCCAQLKTQALLNALREGGYDAAFGGARREEEKSRAKERVYSFRDAFGQWDPKNQRPELWNLYNGAHQPRREHPRLSALQLDGAGYLALYLSRAIPVVPMYFAAERQVVQREGQLIPIYDESRLLPGEKRSRCCAAAARWAATPAPASSAPPRARWRKSSRR